MQNEPVNFKSSQTIFNELLKKMSYIHDVESMKQFMNNAYGFTENMSVFHGKYLWFELARYCSQNNIFKNQ
jgi:hypothetical protein